MTELKWQGFPGGLEGKESATMQETRVQSLCWEDPLGRKWQLTPVLLPRKSHGRRSLIDYSPWGRKESDMTERLLFPFLSFPKWQSKYVTTSFFLEDHHNHPTLLTATPPTKKKKNQETEMQLHLWWDQATSVTSLIPTAVSGVKVLDAQSCLTLYDPHGL